jgi:multidrug efflux pump subunit AcrB
MRFRHVQGMAGRLASLFVDSKLTVLAVLASLCAGAFAVLMLPREEEPQILVPMVDVQAALPGATAEEAESRLGRPLEKVLWEIPGLEYLYVTSSPGGALLIARFEVGTPPDVAVARVQARLAGRADVLPAGVPAPSVRARTIDDVPVFAVTFHGARHDHAELRRIAAQVEESLKSLPSAAETALIGGRRSSLRIQLDPGRMSALGVSPAQVMGAIQASNQPRQLGSRAFGGEQVDLQVGGGLADAEAFRDLVVAQKGGQGIRLGDVAVVRLAADDPTDYVFHGTVAGTSEPAVTLTLAKRPGANATEVVRQARARIEALRGKVIPSDVAVTISRDYGRSAAEKSDELLLHMGIAVFGVTLLILLFLGWRESAVVLLAIPATLALTLLVFYLYGYTLNRITLFALIFSIGILVDDAIVVIENVVRHQRLAGNRERSLLEVALEAVDEVGNPTILATWAVIAAILPMAFVGGLMGPYMRPIPVGATAAMVFSLFVAFTITPWAAVRLLRRHAPAADHAAGPDGHEVPQDFLTRLYYRVIGPLLDQAKARWLFLVAIAGLLFAAVLLVPFGAVEVKMLPFDNKSEFQVSVKMPEGTTLERTAQVAQELARAAAAEPEVADYQVYVGIAAPFNFNGLVRHSYLRRGANVADVQVNLVGKDERSAQSHDVAKRVRQRLLPIARRKGATLAVSEVPPGPPVLQTLVAEVYGPDEASRVALAGQVKEIFRTTPGVVDVDWYVEAPQPRVIYQVDQAKVAAHGLGVGEVGRMLQLATQGLPVSSARLPREREEIPVVLELDPAWHGSPQAPLALPVSAAGAPDQVSLRELVRPVADATTPSLYRKNLQPVTYVVGDVAGSVESPAYALFGMQRRLHELSPGLRIHHLSQPDQELEPAMKWDGEWHITLEVFRDLGIAFTAVLVLIYMLMVGWFRDYFTPFIVMTAIPFSLIGILPAHWALGAFFTATSMIGFMAGAGIVVRNSIILVDFIELRLAAGADLRAAVIEAGAVRFRPMLLTALAVIVGAAVILADPIFQGLAISLMFGEIASLLVSRMAVPVLYYLWRRRRPSVA